MERKIVKVQVRGVKKVVAGSNFQELLDNAQEKFQMPEGRLYFEDGTEIDDDGLPLLQNGDIIILKDPEDVFNMNVLSSPPPFDWEPPSLMAPSPSPNTSLSETTSEDTISEEDCSTSTSTSMQYAADKFPVPWVKFPTSLMESCQQKERPSARDRREMIRILASEIHVINTHPGRKVLSSICKAIITRYPDSFKDMWGDVLIGEGYKSLFYQLENKLNDLNRTKAKKNQGVDNTPGTEQHKKRHRDAYGCVNFAAKLGGKEEEMKVAQEFLKEEANKNRFHSVQIENKLKESYPLQRKLLTSEPPPAVDTVKREWPHLVEYHGLILHTSTLMDVPLQGKFNSQVKEKAPIIEKYAKTVSDRKVQDVFTEIGALPLAERSPMISWIRLIPAIFREACSDMIVFMEKLPGPQDDVLDTEPFLAAVDGHLLSDANFYLCIDKKIINTHPVNNPLEAILMLFSSYYMLNIQYSQKYCVTMEFIQRCFLGINPDKGTKSKQKKTSVHPQIVTFLTKLQTKEWNMD